MKKEEKIETVEPTEENTAPATSDAPAPDAPAKTGVLGIETVPVYMTVENEALLNECFEAMDISSVEDKLLFLDNAALAFAKASLRASVSRWSAVCNKYSNEHLGMTGQQVIDACKKINKYKHVFAAAETSAKLLADKF
jgi:hypothetical protein